MFTVKWIASNGAQMIYASKGDVSYTPPENVPNGGNDGKAKVTFYIPEGDVHCTIDSGRVYVMNDAGRTVADYILQTKEFPHGLAPRE